MFALLYLDLEGLAGAHPAFILNKTQSCIMEVTFNDYSAQFNTYCGSQSRMYSIASPLRSFPHVNIFWYVEVEVALTVQLPRTSPLISQAEHALAISIPQNVMANAQY